MAIKVKKDVRTIRETTAPFQYNGDDGELKTEDIRVVYYSPTTQQAREIQEEMRKRMENKDEMVAWYVSDTLIRRLHSLPDLVDEKDKPYKITQEFLDSLDTVNLNAINDAITEDITAGKPQPAK